VVAVLQPVDMKVELPAKILAVDQAAAMEMQKQAAAV
jgi:hypothetical protein